MILSCVDRLNIQGMLPNSGNLVTMATTFEIVNLIKFTSDENARLGIQERDSIDGKFISFPVSKNFEKCIDLTSSHIVFLKNCIEKVDSENKVTLQAYETIQRITSMV